MYMYLLCKELLLAHLCVIKYCIILNSTGIIFAKGKEEKHVLFIHFLSLVWGNITNFEKLRSKKLKSFLSKVQIPLFKSYIMQSITITSHCHYLHLMWKNNNFSWNIFGKKMGWRSWLCWSSIGRMTKNGNNSYLMMMQSHTVRGITSSKLNSAIMC